MRGFQTAMLVVFLAACRGAGEPTPMGEGPSQFSIRERMVVYDGSYLEWSASEDRPVMKGSEAR